MKRTTKDTKTTDANAFPWWPLWFSSSVLQTLIIHVRCADSCRPVQSEDGIGLVGNSRKNRENPKERKCETISGFRSFGLSRFSWLIRQHRADDVAIGGNNAQYLSIPFRIWFRLCRAGFDPWLKNGSSYFCTSPKSPCNQSYFATYLTRENVPWPWMFRFSISTRSAWPAGVIENRKPPGPPADSPVGW